MGIKILLIIVATSVWVYFDARLIRARSQPVRGIFNPGPSRWMLFCLLFWVIGFPLYLIHRKKVKEAADAFYLGEVMKFSNKTH
ncbi:MAG: hypothetical protein P4L42_07770 [Desulfocapsaceae bacterium]|nr:hypothetical protein [Desulfocapsaceae bacterium]